MIRTCDLAVERSWVKYFRVHIVSQQNIVFIFLSGNVGGNGEMHVVC